MTSEELKPKRLCFIRKEVNMKLTLNGSAIKKVHQDNSIDLLCNEEQLYECLDNVRIGLIAKYLFMRLNNGNAYKSKT